MEATQFTHAELGALLLAVGTIMIQYNLCAGAAMDGDSDSQLVDIMTKNGVDGERAWLLCNVDLAEAVEVVHLSYQPTMADFKCTGPQ